MRYFLLISALALVSEAAAQPTDYLAPPVEVLVEEALSVNPAVRASRFDRLAAEQRVGAVRALPAPTFGVEFDEVPLADPNPLGGMAVTEYSLSQMFPFPGKVGARMAVEEAGVNVALQDQRSIELAISSAVKRTYVDLWLIERQMQVNQNLRELLAEFARTSERLLGVGQVNLQAVLTAQAELARRQTEEHLLSSEYSRALAGMNALLNRAPGHPLGQINQLPEAPGVTLSVEVLERRMSESRPDVVATRSEVDAETARIRAARREFYPDIGLHVMAMQMGPAIRNYGAGIRLSLPIAPWAGQSVRRLADEATFRRQAQEQRLEALINTARSEIHRAAHAVEAARERVALYEVEVVPRAEHAARAAEAAFQVGGADYLSLLDSYRVLESVRLEYLAARADYHRSLTDLEEQVGGSFSEPKRQTDE